jgi:hypothetical protein
MRTGRPRFLRDPLPQFRYHERMNTKTRELLKQVETWPEADQDELVAVARLIESRRTGVYRLSDDERAAVRKGVDAARRGDFAPDDEIEAFYQLHRKA